jgi:hypothetical protein
MSTTGIAEATHIAQPAKCKLCNAVIGHFALTWPPPPDGSFNQSEFGKLFEALTAHMLKRSEGERDAIENARLTAPRGTTIKPLPCPHQQAMQTATLMGGNLSQIFLARHFTLPAGAHGYLEQCRGYVNHMTSRFTLTPEYAEQIAVALLHNLETRYRDGARDLDIECPEAIADVKAALLAIAARYEEGHPQPAKDESQRVQ